MLPDSQIVCIKVESETHLYCGLAVQFHDIATPLGAKIKETYNIEPNIALLPGTFTPSTL